MLAKTGSGHAGLERAVRVLSAISYGTDPAAADVEELRRIAPRQRQRPSTG